MMEVLDGKGAVLGRLASYAAKQALKGHEIVVVNSEEVIITGNRKHIRDDWAHKKTLIGSGQKGPKYSRSTEKIVKRAIRGMLPEHREGRGRDAWKKIRCYDGVPKEYESAKKVTFESNQYKFMKVSEIYK